MTYYIRQFKDDFVNCNITITTDPNGSFQLSWFKGNATFDVQSNSQVINYPNTPTITDTLIASKVLTEKKTGLPLNNPHQIIACGVSEENGNFVFVDVLKYTYNLKTSTGYFISASKIRPILYILVPFSDSPVTDWTFIAVANSFKVNNQVITETFDIDINKTIADVADEYLPGITLSKQDTTISAQLKDADGKPVSKAGVDVYFETTTGYLTKSRSTTNAAGIATTELIGADTGKVKAGFKYFSGKTQIII